jgi:hypothetical protein
MPGRDLYSEYYRFIVVKDLAETHTVVLSDFRYWTEHTDLLIKYCDTHGLDYQGMAITNLSDYDLMMFKLYWE